MPVGECKRTVALEIRARLAERVVLRLIASRRKRPVRS